MLYIYDSSFNSMGVFVGSWSPYNIILVALHTSINNFFPLVVHARRECLN